MFSQSKNWCFTDFELLDWTKIYDESDEIDYVCYGKETCPKTKKKHYQGWIQFKTKRRLNGCKKLCQSKKLHVEACRGTESENEKYCQKDNKYKKIGEFTTQGKRTDLDSLKKLIDLGGTMYDIAQENFPTYIMFNRGFEKYKQLIDKRSRQSFRKVEVIHVYGRTGTGKTRWALEDSQDCYMIKGKGLKWWDGYDGEKNIIIDEYDNDVRITELLGLLDGHPHRLDVKGGFTWANWNKVIITSNYGKLHKGAKREHRRALKRRITQKIKMSRSA